ncbi:hypothetical protein HYE67_008804 [Fusarium culmorum]|uniref:Uncharacterized protein n=1 Tax=Fusarium culmorum TaxID=5516 RepID=A0A7S8DDI8_FUSCU|nr:hypothetical protein HYE67_008804 [Fusarium culmorum]
MDSRDKVPGQQEKRTLDYRGALTSKPSKHVDDGPRSGHLTDLSGFEGTPAQQSNTHAQGSETHRSSASTKECLSVEGARVGPLRHHSEEKVDAQRPAVRRRTDNLTGIVTRFSETVADWLGHPSAHQDEQLYEKLALAHKRSIDVESQYQQLQMDNQTLQKMVRKANTKLAEAVKERDELQQLVDTANWTGAAKTSDDTIRSKWKQLDYNIRIMARVLAKCPTKRPTDSVNRARFSSIVSSWPKLLKNDDYKELLITAYLWVLVDGEIFKNGNKFWGGGLIGDLKGIREHLVGLAPDADQHSRSGPTMRHVAKWSAQGTALLGHFDRRDNNAPQRRAMIALERMEHFCNIAAEKEGTDFIQEMKDIMETALDLDKMLMGSMTILSVQWPNTGRSKSARYDPDGMEAVAHTTDLPPNTDVAFIISPMRLKMGNANGCNYESEMVLYKASVVCV